MKRSVGLGSLVCMAATAVPALFGTGVVPAKVDLLNGVAWLPNEVNGDIVRINGESGLVDAKVSAGAGVGVIEVDQDGSTVLVRVGDQLRSLDVADLNWGPESASGAGALVVGERAAYVVSDDGTVRALDPVTMATLGEVSLGAAPAGPATVVNRRLVVPLVDGSVKVVARDRIVADVDAGQAGDRLHVTAVGKKVAVLNATAGELRRLDPATGKAGRAVDVELPEGELVVPTELPAGRLWILAPRSGELLRISLASGQTKSQVIAGAGGDLTGPAVLDGHVYVVDRSAGVIIDVDAGLRAQPITTPLEVTDASRVELVVEGGKVFVNDPTSERAFVIDGDGPPRKVDKYKDEGAAEATPDEPDANAPSQPGPEAPGATPVAPAPPPEPVPPEPPVNVQAQAGNESATVSWSPGAGAWPASRFHVTYDGLDDPIEVSGDQLSVEVGDLTNGDTYVFEVWASNDAGESEPVSSNPVVPNDRIPGVPGRVTAASLDASATVRWEAADDRGREIAGYVVTSSPGGLVREVAGTATELAFTGLTNGTDYTFTVTAVNDLDVQGEASAPSNLVRPYGVPGQVPSANVVPDDGSAAVSWQAAQNFSPQAVRYQITTSPAAGRTSETQGLTQNVTGLANGVSYNIIITPVNDRGAGQPLSVPVTPGRAPRVNSANATLNSARQFEVNVDIDNGGHPTTCSVASSGGGGPFSCNDGSATVDVPQYDSDYTFTVTVSNDFGNGTGSDSGRSGGKPLTVDNVASRWDGSTCWDDAPYHRPILGVTTPCTAFVAWVPFGNTVQGLCWTTGTSHRDDNLNYSTTFIYVRWGGNEGYMSHLYFTSWASQPDTISGLRHC